MSKHDWQYKRVDTGYWVICTECGKSGGVVSTEEEAEARMAALRTQGGGSPVLQRMFPKRRF